MRELAHVDYAVIAVFFAVMVGVGVYYSRRAKSAAQFFGGDGTVDDVKGGFIALMPRTQTSRKVGRT